jgi:hypothetical protein
MTKKPISSQIYGLVPDFIETKKKSNKFLVKNHKAESDINKSSFSTHRTVTSRKKIKYTSNRFISQGAFYFQKL